MANLKALIGTDQDAFAAAAGAQEEAWRQAEWSGLHGDGERRVKYWYPADIANELLELERAAHQVTRDALELAIDKLNVLAADPGRKKPCD